MENRPISRNNKFFSEREFTLEKKFALEYIHGDLNTKILLFKVDKSRTNTDDLYGEAYKEDIYVDNPVEIPVKLNLAPSKNKAYNSDGTLRYAELGNLEFIVFLDTLEELQIDITYGDFVGYQITEGLLLYFQVSNDDLKPYANQNTIGGYKPYFKKIIANPVDNIEFEKE